MKFNALVCCAVLAAMSCDDADAADLGGKTRSKPRPPPPPAPDVVEYTPAPAAPAAIWQGVYWGLSAGYGWGDSEQNYDRNANHGVASTSPHGAIGAVTLGYNHLWSPNLLVGVEGDLGLMDISADDKIVYDGHVYRTSFGPWWGTVRARAGFLWDRALIYGTAGVAFMAVDEVSIGNTPGETAINRDVRSGWVVGGGVEYAILPGVTGKIEYLHMDFGTYDGFSDNREDFSFKNRVDLVRTGFNVKY